MTLCLCGCGGEAKPGRKYIRYHYKRKKNQNALQSSSAGNFPMPFQDPPPTPGTPDTSWSSSIGHADSSTLGNHKNSTEGNDAKSGTPDTMSYNPVRPEEVGDHFGEGGSTPPADTSHSSIRMHGAGQRNDTSVPAPIIVPVNEDMKFMRRQMNLLAIGLFLSLMMNALLLIIQVFPEVLK